MTYSATLNAYVVYHNTICAHLLHANQDHFKDYFFEPHDYTYPWPSHMAVSKYSFRSKPGRGDDCCWQSLEVPGTGDLVQPRKRFWCC